jgi:DNA polymerase-3 subunit delta'
MTSNVFTGLPDDKKRLAHAYVVTGSDQDAISTHLVELAKSILCTDNQGVTNRGCGQCKSCLLLDANNHPDFLMLGEETGGIGIEEVRGITDFLHKTSQISQGQVVWLFGAERMSENARNALLKTLEEPTAKSYLLLQTKDKAGLGATILSRCQEIKLPTKSKERLLSEYSDLPNYLIGFCNGAESKLVTWKEADQVSTFVDIYEAFIQWLKYKAGYPTLMELVRQDEELEAFLCYLLERRVRQLLLKEGMQTQAIQALEELKRFTFAHQQIKGQNRSLALASCLGKMEEWIR